MTECRALPPMIPLELRESLMAEYQILASCIQGAMKILEANGGQACQDLALGLCNQNSRVRDLVEEVYDCKA